MMYAHYVPGFILGIELMADRVESFDTYPFRQLAYEDTDQYQLTKGFLADPSTFLEMLFAKPPKG